MIIAFVYMAFFAPKGEEEFPIAVVSEKAEKTPKIFENWTLWIIVTLLLVAFAYTIPLIDIIQNAPAGSPDFKLW